MDIRQAIKEKERIAGEIEKMLEKFSKETGLFVSDISISSTRTIMYDVITRSHRPAYSYAARVEVKL